MEPLAAEVETDTVAKQARIQPTFCAKVAVNSPTEQGINREFNSSQQHPQAVYACTLNNLHSSAVQDESNAKIKSNPESEQRICM